MAGTPIHDWCMPKIEALLRDAAAQGFARDAVVAVMADLVLSPAFNTAPLPPEPPVHPIAGADPVAAEMETPELLLPDMERHEIPMFLPPGYGPV